MLIIKDKIDILVGIPTLNEADTITNVVKNVDVGLCKYFHSYNALIVNIDSGSKDNTPFVFNKTITKTPKLTIKGKDKIKGKGTNLFALIDYAVEKEVKYICTVDGDLYSIKPVWIKKLVSPLINNDVDYVTPLYTRNRFEGNTTNHFCVPFLKYAFNKEIRQPIGGEYAFNYKFAKYVLKEQKPAYSFKYGIDMFLTGHASGGGFNISEVWLGKKMHKPSFGKMLSIFEQEAGASYFIMNRYKNTKNNVSCVNSAKKRLAIDPFFKKPEANSIKERGEVAIKLFQEMINNQNYKGLSENLVSEIKNNSYQINSKLWIKILQALFQYTESRKKLTEKEIERLAKLTLPLYLFRVLTYFKEIEGKSTGYIESILNYDLINHHEIN